MATYEAKFTRALNNVFGDAVKVEVSQGIVILSLPEDETARLSMFIDSSGVDKRKPIDGDRIVRWIDNAVAKERRLISCAYTPEAADKARTLIAAMGY
jgi:hypothetical protein